MALIVDVVVALVLFFALVVVLSMIGGVGSVELSILLGITLAVLLVRHWRRP